MADSEQPRRKPLFRVPTPAEVEKRQQQVQQSAATIAFKPSTTSSSTSSNSNHSQTTPPSSIPFTSKPSPSNPTHSTPALVSVAVPAPTAPALQPAPALAQRQTFGQQFAALKETPQYAQSRELAAAQRASEPAAGPAGASNASAQQNKANPTLQRSRSSNSVLVNRCQEGNTVLSHIRNVPWEYSDIIADYQVGQTTCALFLSLKYHRIHPEYIHTRIKQLGQHYLLRILLCLVDIADHQQSIRDLTRVCLYNNITLVLSWSPEEAGRYLETFKAYEHKPPDLIKERIEGDYLSKLTDSLTQIKSVNKTDVVTLTSTFGSLQKIIQASPDDLSSCPGFGQQKVRRLYEAFNQPFVLNKRQKKS
ncbi:Excision repair cross-complementation group 1 [Rhizophlyctis rosea]|uniref:DNA excision repair protein ERCC-1 n=1 Tax=Rhizophlyctis rosea TaxID=64517 RepID=A0AAD5SKR4_9FUNG|nr:Excision repair cross-complementation group 1 [Rhizophlyctis rosea]